MNRKKRLKIFGPIIDRIRKDREVDPNYFSTLIRLTDLNTEDANWYKKIDYLSWSDFLQIILIEEDL